jgi:hypothetical protein
VTRGELKIAEVASRFTNADDFVSLVSSIGFRMVMKVLFLVNALFSASQQSSSGRLQYPLHIIRVPKNREKDENGEGVGSD